MKFLLWRHHLSGNQVISLWFIIFSFFFFLTDFPLENLFCTVCMLSLMDFYATGQIKTFSTAIFFFFQFFIKIISFIHILKPVDLFSNLPVKKKNHSLYYHNFCMNLNASSCFCNFLYEKLAMHDLCVLLTDLKTANCIQTILCPLFLMSKHIWKCRKEEMKCLLALNCRIISQQIIHELVSEYKVSFYCFTVIIIWLS